MAKPSLTFLAKAQDDMVEMRRYSLREFGSSVADHYVDEIERLFRLLRDNPRMGAARNEFGTDIRSLTKKKHRVLYRLEGNEVQIVRVMHHARKIAPDDLP